MRIEDYAKYFVFYSDPSPLPGASLWLFQQDAQYPLLRKGEQIPGYPEGFKAHCITIQVNKSMIELEPLIDQCKKHNIAYGLV